MEGMKIVPNEVGGSPVEKNEQRLVLGPAGPASLPITRCTPALPCAQGVQQLRSSTSHCPAVGDRLIGHRISLKIGKIGHHIRSPLRLRREIHMYSLLPTDYPIHLLPPPGYLVPHHHRPRRYRKEVLRLPPALRGLSPPSPQPPFP